MWCLPVPGTRPPGPNWLLLATAPCALLEGCCKSEPTARTPGGGSPGCDGLAFRFWGPPSVGWGPESSRSALA
eukprot:1376455-Alexandrium_andersonii.AAC.1